MNLPSIIDKKHVRRSMQRISKHEHHKMFSVTLWASGRRAHACLLCIIQVLFAFLNGGNLQRFSITGPPPSPPRVPLQHVFFFFFADTMFFFSGSLQGWNNRRGCICVLFARRVKENHMCNIFNSLCPSVTNSSRVAKISILI